VLHKALICVLLLSACAQPDGSSAAELSNAQTLSFPIRKDLQDLDPATMGILAPDLGIARNIFGGLYQFDAALKVVPDIAVGPPDISADGLTYTFHLRRDARFSNGDPVTASNFVYSWNRVESLASSSLRLIANPAQTFPLLEVVKGYDDVRTGRSKSMVGLAALDDHTLIVTLSRPAGYWLAELALPYTWVLDERVIRSRGEETWWTTPEGLVGTGPFRMTSRAPGQSLEFAPVDNWWGGSTGHLKKMRVEIVPDLTAQVAGYRNARYDVVGAAEAGQFVHEEDLTPFLAAASDEVRRGELFTGPAWSNRTLSFNVVSGPLSQAEDGQKGRQALSLAIDRQKVADAVCGTAKICAAAASGGILLPGMSGYLGDKGDLYRPREAKSLLQAWDPDGSKLKGLKIATSSRPPFLRMAENVRNQWATNLGVHADVEVLQANATLPSCGNRPESVAVNGYILPFDEPRFWYRSQFVAGGGCWGGYQNASFEALLNTADLQQPSQAGDAYVKAGRLLVDDAAFVGVLYTKRFMLIKPYIRGAGFNAVYDGPWSEIKILKH